MTSTVLFLLCVIVMQLVLLAVVWRAWGRALQGWREALDGWDRAAAAWRGTLRTWEAFDRVQDRLRAVRGRAQ